jgi:hypothetical protein
MKRVKISLLAAVFALTAAGCAKNVERIEFTKWGHSYVPNKSSMDTTAQGGAQQNNVVPTNGVQSMPKASVGGSYHRTFSQSPNFKMVGGFHVTPGQ